MPATPEEEWTYWDTKATELRRTQLGTVQASATKWSALMTALLGVFGTVAFAGGLTTIDKLGHPWDRVAKILTTAAAASAVLAIVALALAAGGLLVSRGPGLTATSVRDRQTTQLQRGLKRLHVGRLCAVLDAALVIAGSTIVLWAGEAKSTSSSGTFLAVVDGKAVCGPLTKDANGALVIGGATLKKVTQLVPTSSCP